MTRDDKGRFVKGGSGNPSGRPKDEAGAMLRAALSRKLTQTDADKVIEKLIEQARRGDHKAREHLFAMSGIDLRSVTLKGDESQPLRIVVEHVRDTDQTT